jgi:hypothetical protein
LSPHHRPEIAGTQHVGIQASRQHESHPRRELTAQELQTHRRSIVLGKNGVSRSGPVLEVWRRAGVAETYPLSNWGRAGVAEAGPLLKLGRAGVAEAGPLLKLGRAGVAEVVPNWVPASNGAVQEVESVEIHHRSAKMQQCSGSMTALKCSSSARCRRATGRQRANATEQHVDSVIQRSGATRQQREWTCPAGQQPSIKVAQPSTSFYRISKYLILYYIHY